MSKAAAIDAARDHVAPHVGTLIPGAAAAGLFKSLGGGAVVAGVRPDQWVWSVAFVGSFPLACPATPAGSANSSVQPSCAPIMLAHDTVILDYTTGGLILEARGP